MLQHEKIKVVTMMMAFINKHDDNPYDIIDGDIKNDEFR